MMTKVTATRKTFERKVREGEWEVSFDENEWGIVAVRDRKTKRLIKVCIT